MTRNLIRSTHLARAQLADYERLAWFLFGTFERERRLNLEALYASPPFATMALLSAMQPVFLFPLSWLAISATKE